MSQPAGYRHLDDVQILATLVRLRDRIAERFPDSGLSRVADELLWLGNQTAAFIAYVQRPHWPIRVGVGLGLGAMAFVPVPIVTSAGWPAGINGLDDVAPALDAAINDLVFLGATVFFLVTLESRPKRRKTLAALHPLRSLAQLGRYLDYCSELLSLISKIAALHVQRFNEPVVLGAVNEIEALTTGLSGKIWQKITVLDRE